MSILPVERLCTCCISIDDNDDNRRSIPEPVDLLWCITCDDENGASSVEYTTSSTAIMNNQNNGDVDNIVTAEQQLLLHNFEKYGWSPICIRWNAIGKQELSSLSAKSKIHCMSAPAYDLLRQYSNWEEIHSELFHRVDNNNGRSSISHAVDNTLVDNDDNFTNGVLRYVPSESGASGTTIAEAKVSWEYQRRRRHPHRHRHRCHADSAIPVIDDVSNTDEKLMEVRCRLQAWTEILHAVIGHVMNELQLPTEHLIVNYSDTEDRTFIKDTNSDETSSSLQPLDLLRAFRYDPVSKLEENKGGMTNSYDDNEKTTAHPVLGSSSHTDWGSWTVVWQDDTTYPPCLQTYCYHCEKWNPVIPPMSLKKNSCDDTVTDNTANFIVHVGDITSLCIRHAIQHGQNITKKSSSSPSSSNETVPDSTNIWPSPRHRVISPQQHKYRHSLVYFVYPPSLETTTPARIIESLYNWCHTHYANTRELDHQRIPYEDYSLLSDQSASINIDTSTDTITNTDMETYTKDDENTRHVVVIATHDNEKHRQQWSTIQDIPIRKIIEEKWKQVQR